VPDAAFGARIAPVGPSSYGHQCLVRTQRSLANAYRALWTTRCGLTRAPACSGGMNVVQHMYRLGGVADRATIIALTSRKEFDRAVRTGEVVRDGYGRYAVPVADQALRAANALSAVVSHRSAALHHGWELKTVPALPELTAPKGRTFSPALRAGIDLHRTDLGPDDVEGRTTSIARTLVDCMRSLPFDEALAVADSALRHESISPSALLALAAGVQGPGARQCRRVAREASGDAANPFESVLRAISLDVPGICLVPQLEIRAPSFSVQPDLVDRQHRIVAEADSFAWHGDRQALRADCQRYTNLVVRGWIVVRYSWEDVMHDPAYVRRTLIALAGIVAERTNRPGSRRIPA
jgi:very-short-patch-repair endonuclease